ncbi:hypothetical protein AAHE18_18G139200 [Arachis hypogaea]
MLCIKAEGNQSQESFKQWATLIRKIAPEGSAIPRDYYEAKKLVQKLGLKAIKIDCCSNNCMLYRKDDAALTSCKFCEAPRFKPISDGGCKSKRVPVRRMHYLPLIPRLRRLYASMSSAPHMTWHIKNQRDDGVMTHPSHGEAWKSFDRIHSDFALEPRNIRLGLCSDGFTPNIQFSKPYSCWPVIVIPYNLPPGMCMKDPYLFLTCLIPGPNNPKANIDVFLGPLIDELNELWNPGVLTYDIVEKKNFVLKAALMWTINDFPAYGMLSGWMTQGRLSCPICMEDTKSFTLSHGGKASWFDCHRRFLPTNHPYRRNKNDFRKNKIESEEAPTRLSGLEIWQRVKGLGKISDNGKWIKSREYGITHNWTKQSVFWELPYWKDNLVRHCLDVMHIEKNVLDNIMNTVMDTDRTKDNEKARLDLAELCKRPDLHLRHVGDNCWSKPKAAYTLTSEQQQDVYRWVQQLRFPDGYASNLARCVSLSQGRFIGMKSHDCHIFMQCLLPTAFRELPTNIWKPLTELSQFFKDLCSTTLKVHDLEVMEQNIPIILCKLERIFPPGFFNVMEHLPIHLAYEARVCGPVQYRWMYPFERVIGAFKRTVKNRARVEGSICEAFLAKETSSFVSFYFEPHILSRRTRVGRNDDGEDTIKASLSIFNRPGRKVGKAKDHWLDERDKAAAHLHILLNESKVSPFYIKYKQHNQVMAPRVKGKGVKGHRSSHTTTAAAISTTSTSSGTSVVPDFQSGSLSQQPYLMVPNPGYTGLPPPSWPTPGCMGPPPPPPPPISIPPPLRNSNLLVDSETPGSSSTSPPSETASVPNSVTKERLVPDGKTSWLPFPPGSQKITEIIKKRYDKPYKKFGDVPLPTKKLWFKEWKSHFLIDDDDDEFFWRTFKYRTSKRFSQMMSDIREGVDTTHEWLIPAYKKVLERYWETDEKWKNIRKKARENRASLLGGSVHCGGSIPLSSTIERMVT